MINKDKKLSLKKLFGFAERISAPHIPPAEHEDTWILQDKYHDLIKENLWIIELFIYLSISGKTQVGYEELGLSDEVVFKKVISKYLMPFIEDGDLVFSKGKIHLKNEHVYMPKNKKWDDIRIMLLNKNLKQIIPQFEQTADALKSGILHRSTVHKFLTKKQAQEWVEKLKNLELEFSMTKRESSKSGSDEVYLLLNFLAPRQLIATDDIEKAGS
jgi:hypothetical protein